MKLTFNDYLVLCFLLLFLGGTKTYAFPTTTLSDSLVVRKDSGDISSSKELAGAGVHLKDILIRLCLKTQNLCYF